jgi:hypothetical protein
MASILISSMTLATAATAVCGPSKPCTSTITEFPGACCPPIAGHTTTSYSDCGSCALEITTLGVQCLVACPTTTPTSFGITTTITGCASGGRGWEVV